MHLIKGFLFNFHQFFILLNLMRKLSFFIILCGIFSLLTSSKLVGQNTDKLIDEGWGIGVSFSALQQFNVDKTFSSLTYSGVMAGYNIHSYYNGNKAIHSFNISYAAGSIKANNMGGGSAKSKYANLDYLLLFKLNADDESFLNINMGTGLSVLYSDRKYNNFINDDASFEFASSFDAAFLLQHTFKQSLHGFSISEQLCVPAISYLVQPTYGYDAFPNASNKTSLYNKSIVSFSSLLRLKNCFSLDKVINNKQKIGLHYTWDYYHTSKTRDVVNASHSIALSYYHAL